MERDELIEMLNEDLKDEHVSITRYLIHAYQVGEDTPFGSMLLSTAREEMWHMNWLGDEIGELDAEPVMEQGVYPHDPTSNASLLRSYIEWEDNLVKVYAEQAERVESRELKRILQQLGLESITHRRRFQMWLDRLGPEGEEPFEFEEVGSPRICSAGSSGRSIASINWCFNICATLSSSRRRTVPRAANLS